MKNNKISAFTLVELIVVITILAVLATVAFISFQGYTSSSRDSVRLADLKNISKSFEINRTKGVDFPLPDKKVDISSSGTIFQYQGELSQNILNSDLNIFDGGIDPLTGENYGYAVNSARNKFQIIGFLENQESVANISLNTTLADNSDKYVKSSGDTLGILLDESTNEVIVQSGSLVEIDIENTSKTYNILVHHDIQKVVPGDLPREFIYNQKPNISCQTILYSGKSNGSGVYMINPTGVEGEEFEVYCDMETNGGGWTLFYANNGLDTSAIKKSYTGMRQNIFYSGGTYDLTDFDNESLAGLVDYRLFTNNGSTQVMIKDYNDLSGNIITQFDSSDNLAWALGEDILANGAGGGCVPIPNDGFMNIDLNYPIDNSNPLLTIDVVDYYKELKYLMNHAGSSWGISHPSYQCNGFNDYVIAHYGFYNAFNNANDQRARASYTYKLHNSPYENKFRYFIK